MCWTRPCHSVGTNSPDGVGSWGGRLCIRAPRVNLCASTCQSEACDVTRAQFGKAASDFVQARDQLLELRADAARACAEFAWPKLSRFNWATDYFDVVSQTLDRAALLMVDDQGAQQVLSYKDLSRRSAQVANYLSGCGVGRGDRVLVMLGNVAPLWETMLAVIKLGAVMIPATTLLQREDLQDRLERGAVR